MQPYRQVEFVVTLNKDNKFETTTLSINSKQSNEILEWRNLSEGQLAHYIWKAAIKWFDESNNIAIINYWFKEEYSGYYDDYGTFHFDE